MRKVSAVTDTADINGEFTEGNVAQGVPPTILKADIFNTWQRELVNIVTSSGMDLDPNDDGQILKAINKLLSVAAAVTSVNNKKGAVTLSAGDVHAWDKTEADARFIFKTSDTMSGSLTAKYVASTPSVMPEGAGSFSGQLDSKAPFYQPNWQWPVTSGGIYVPIVKGAVTRQGQGYPTALSFGYLLNGTPSFAVPCIHAKGDNIDVNWRFDPNSGQFYSPGNILASGAILHTDGNITGNIWGGYLSTWLNNSISNAQNNAQNWAYQNLVQGVRLSGRTVIRDSGGRINLPSGCVYTGMSGSNYNPDIWAAYSAVQVLINGQWATIGTV
ncbi:TPA: hypothetical protein ACF2D8_000099 [Serratia marcescens]